MAWFLSSDLIAVRAANFAATISISGIFAFVYVVARPAYRTANLPLPTSLLRALRFLSWASLALALLTSFAWSIGISRALGGAVGVVLLKTQFGHVMLMRVGMILCVATGIGGLGRRSALGYFYVPLTGALIAAAAWQGHAGADIGWGGAIHLAADISHLLAAGIWLGGLLPLALFLVTALHGDGGGVLPARVGVSRFSMLGLVCISTLFLSGLINTWFLSGTLPALVGTPYGWLLLAKLAIFCAILGFAALNRYRLMPRILLDSDTAFVGRGMVRNTLIEAALGLLVIAIVGVLGTLVPGLHQEPIWPFAERFTLDSVQADPSLRYDAIGSSLSALVGLFVFGFALYRGRVFLAVIGAILVFGFGWHAVDLVLVPATPNSYAVSPQPFTAVAIANGHALYLQNCVSCHGPDGHGDGPLAARSPIPVADLTAHLFMHTEGDLYSFVTDGIDGGVMPSFAATISDGDRWDLIAFLEARADASQSGLVLDWDAPQSFADRVSVLAPRSAMEHRH
jgi:putative copper export protein